MCSQRLIALLTLAATAVLAGCGQVGRSVSPASDPSAAATSTRAQPADAPVVYLDVDGTLIAAAPDGAGGWFIGGRFRHVAGQPRAGLAHVGADGELDPAWRPVVSGRARFPHETAPENAEVSALSTLDDKVYVGGLFTSVNGQPRKHLAAVNARTGRLLAWRPRPDWPVDALAANSGIVYVGGLFSRIGRNRRARLAAFDVRTGALTGWNPGVAGRVREVTEPEVTVLLLDRERLYVGGRFTEVGGRDHYGLAAFDDATGALNRWSPRGGEVFALAVSGNTVYAGGVAMYADESGFSDEGVVAFDARTGRTLPWRPYVLDEENSPGWVNAVAVVGDRLYVGGKFTSIAGQQRVDLGVVSAVTGAAIPWQPRPSDGDYSLAAAGDHVLVGGGFRIHDG